MRGLGGFTGFRVLGSLIRLAWASMNTTETHMLHNLPASSTLPAFLLEVSGWELWHSNSLTSTVILNFEAPIKAPGKAKNSDRPGRPKTLNPKPFKSVYKPGRPQMMLKSR